MSIATLFLMLAAHADWSAVTSLPPGTEIRVTVGPREVRGIIPRPTNSSSLLLTSDKGEEVFEKQQVSRVSMKKPGHRRRNALIGLGIGAGAGLGIGVGIRAKPDQLHIIPNSAVIGGSAAVGAIIGVVVGVILPTGGWREVYRQ